MRKTFSISRISLVFAFKTRRVFATCVCLEVSKQENRLGCESTKYTWADKVMQSVLLCSQQSTVYLTSLSGVQPRPFEHKSCPQQRSHSVK